MFITTTITMMIDIDIVISMMCIMTCFVIIIIIIIIIIPEVSFASRTNCEVQSCIPLGAVTSVEPCATPKAVYYSMV